MNTNKLSKRDKENILNELLSHYEMNHPNIIRLHDHTEQNGNIYLLLELAEGGNLFNHLNKHIRLEVEAIARLFYQSCKAVEHVHSKGFIHRDLKPENILLDKQLNVKLCDFGWCANINDLEYRKVVSGTYEYMSPETLHGSLQSYESDVWSLGVLLYELHHNIEPFKGRSVQEVLHSIKNVPVVFEFNVCNEAKDLIMSILQPDPSKRPTFKQIFSHPFLHKYGPSTGEEHPNNKDLFRRAHSTQLTSTRQIFEASSTHEKQEVAYKSGVAKENAHRSEYRNEGPLERTHSTSVHIHNHQQQILESNQYRNRVLDNRDHYRPITSKIAQDSRHSKEYYGTQSNRVLPLSSAKREIQGFTSNSILNTRPIDQNHVYHASPVSTSHMHQNSQQIFFPDSILARSRNEMMVPSSNTSPHVVHHSLESSRIHQAIKPKTEGSYGINYLSSSQTSKKASPIYKMISDVEMKREAENKENQQTGVWGSGQTHIPNTHHFQSSQLNASAYNQKQWEQNSQYQAYNPGDSQFMTLSTSDIHNPYSVERGRIVQTKRLGQESYSDLRPIDDYRNSFSRPTHDLIGAQIREKLIPSDHILGRGRKDRANYISIASNKPVLARQNTMTFYGNESGSERSQNNINLSSSHHNHGGILLKRSATFQL